MTLGNDHRESIGSESNPSTPWSEVEISSATTPYPPSVQSSSKPRHTAQVMAIPDIISAVLVPFC
ncbi:hypothetical protein HDU76_005005, partial [Blyttiomyces sp. JEL0837]